MDNKSNDLGGENCIVDSVQAINFAKKKWEEKFGKEIYDKGPFTARLINDSVWFVHSANNPTREENFQKLFFGGVLSIEIRKKDCEVLSISITK